MSSLATKNNELVGFFFLGEKKRNTLLAAKRNETFSQLKKLYFATKINEVYISRRKETKLISEILNSSFATKNNDASLRRVLIFLAQSKFRFFSPRREIVYFIFRFSSPRNFEESLFFVASDDSAYLYFYLNIHKASPAALVLCTERGQGSTPVKRRCYIILYLFHSFY